MTKSQTKNLHDVMCATLTSAELKAKYTQNTQGVAIWNKTALAKAIRTSPRSVYRYFKANNISNRVIDYPALQSQAQNAKKSAKRLESAPKSAAKSPKNAPKTLKNSQKEAQKAKSMPKRGTKSQIYAKKRHKKPNLCQKMAQKALEVAQEAQNDTIEKNELTKVKNTCFTRYTEQAQHIRQLKGEVARLSSDISSLSGVVSRFVFEKEELEKKLEELTQEEIDMLVDKISQKFMFGYKRLFAWLISLSVAYIVIIIILGLR